jgi:hypothetical protein
MFKKSSDSVQFNLYASPVSLFSGKSLNLYEDKTAWHNLFRQQVTMRINESLFSPLFCENNGTPNAPVRVLVAMMVLKEAEGLSDQKLFENCRFNMLTRSAIWLLNVDDSVPSDSTYYLFRKRINEYAKAGNDNLFEAVFTEITKNQCIDFEVSGKSIRMDSKLLGSNIAWLSRYEIIHETLRLFYKQFKQPGKLDKATEERLDILPKLEGNKVVYTCTSEEVKCRLRELGQLIYKILPIFSSPAETSHQTLQTVFNEHFKIDEHKIVVARENAGILAQSIHSPHDTDCNYRNKDGNKVKGYSINVTESCDDKGLNLIGNVDVLKVSTSDVEFFQDDISNIQKVFPHSTEAAHTDGAYHSPANQVYCKKNNIDFYLHAIQEARGRFEFNLLENGGLIVFDTTTNELLTAAKVKNKKNIDKWCIQIEKVYRYFTRKNIDAYLIRKRIDETPIEILQKRNNVEATIFQLGYHYSNDKSRYRGLIKHQMWANIRCLWVNFVRILNYIKQLCQRTSFSVKHTFKCIHPIRYILFWKVFIYKLW